MDKIPFEQNNVTVATDEQIKGWKKKYGQLFRIKVEDKECILHKPDRRTLDLAMKSSKQRDSMFNETILRNCWLSGNKEIITDDDLFMSASSKLDQIIEFKEAELEKL